MTTVERITHARARCQTCGEWWQGVDALEKADTHALQLQHKVTGLQQTCLDVDRRAVES